MSNLLLATLSGVFYVLAFPEWDISPLLWVAIVPWLIILHRQLPWKTTLALTAWMSLIIGVGGFHWVAYSMHQFGGLPIPVCILALVIFSIFGQPQFYFYLVLRRIWVERFALKPGPSRLLILALTYTTCDWVAPKLFRDTLGHAFLGLPNFVQVADIGGPYLLTFIAALISESLCSFLRDEPRWNFRRRWAEALLILGVLAAGELYGWRRARQMEAAIARPARSIPVAAIQANIGDIDKLASESGNFLAAEKVVNTYLDLSENALAHTPRPLAVIWPETAYPALFRHAYTAADFDRERRIEAFVTKNQVPLLFGGYDSDGRRDYNSLFIFSPRQYRVYHKNILLPFGEFIPVIGDMKWVDRLFPQIGNFGRGAGPEAIPIELADGSAVRFQPVICYEALFPWYTRDAARQGNEVILNITNDSWFGPRTEPQLHLLLTVFRSIETRLAQVRATNTGISTLILPNGRMVGTGPIGDVKVLHWEVPILHPRDTWTLHRLWGDWFGKTAASLVALLFIVYELPRRRRRASSHP